MYTNYECDEFFDDYCISTNTRDTLKNIPTIVYKFFTFPKQIHQNDLQFIYNMFNSLPDRVSW